MAQGQNFEAAKAVIIGKLVWREYEPVAVEDLDAQAPMEKDVQEGWLEEAIGWARKPWFWVWVFAFLAVQSTAVLLTGDSFFGLLTGGVVESMRLDTAVPMWRHMLGGTALWSLGFFQCTGKRFRRDEKAWIHRMSGRLYLFIWSFICGPTAAYLSLFCGTGPHNAQISMTVFAMVSLDTTLLAYYYMWRAFVVVKRRARGKDSVALHGQAMQAGMGLTMSILVQRPLQFLVIVLRKLLLLFAWSLPVFFSWTKGGIEGFALYVLDHHVGLSVTTAAFGFYMLMIVDGPRSKMLCQAFPLDAAQAEELLGSSKPHFLELLFWRCRVPVYLILRALVTNAWTSDPNPVPVPN